LNGFLLGCVGKPLAEVTDPGEVDQVPFRHLKFLKKFSETRAWLVGKRRESPVDMESGVLSGSLPCRYARWEQQSGNLYLSVIASRWAMTADLIRRLKVGKVE
jgi:hypothetical protein